MMRSLPLAFAFSALVLFPVSLFAGDARPHKLAAITVKAKTGEASPTAKSIAAIIAIYRQSRIEKISRNWQMDCGIRSTSWKAPG
jgi:hypothetical protein